MDMLKKSPLLDQIAAELPLKAGAHGRLVVVCHQHLLPSNVALFRKLIECGIAPENIFVLGKPYSSVNSTVDEIRRLGIVIQPITYDFLSGHYLSAVTSDCRQLWASVLARHAQNAFSGIIVLDDGGHLRSNLPESLVDHVPIVAIEQTASGIRRHPRFSVPTIVVAHSAAKRHFESPFIAQALLRKLKTLPYWNSSSHIGILGLGFLGRYTAELLKSERFPVTGYDPHLIHGTTRNSVTLCKTLGQVMQNSDLLLGCSGTDVTALDTEIAHGRGTKILISCSSGDVEFNSLLRQLGGKSTNLKNPFADVNGTLNNGGLEVKIINGGFPVNFDRDVEWETQQEIQLTRALLYAGIAQALTLLESNHLSRHAIMLDPHIQRDIVKKWLALPENTDGITRYINHNPHIDWWIKESGGDYLDLGARENPEPIHLKSI